MRGVIATGDHDPRDSSKKAQALPQMEARTWSGVTCDSAFDWTPAPSDEFAPPPQRRAGRPLKVAADFGMKWNILRRFTRTVASRVYPAGTPASELLATRPRRRVPEQRTGRSGSARYAIDNARELIKADVPTFGICLGHQILSLALGGQTYKLKFGHRGANHPVKEHETGRVEITSQNHGFAVDPQTLPSDVR